MGLRISMLPDKSSVLATIGATVVFVALLFILSNPAWQPGYSSEHQKDLRGDIPSMHVEKFAPAGEIGCVIMRKC